MAKTADYVEAAYDDSSIGVGSVLRKSGYEAQTSPVPQGTPEYEEQLDRYDLGPEERRTRAMAAVTPQEDTGDSPLQKGYDTAIEHVRARKEYDAR